MGTKPFILFIYLLLCNKLSPNLIAENNHFTVHNSMSQKCWLVSAGYLFCCLTCSHSGNCNNLVPQLGLDSPRCPHLHIWYLSWGDQNDCLLFVCFSSVSPWSLLLKEASPDLLTQQKQHSKRTNSNALKSCWLTSFWLKQVTSPSSESMWEERRNFVYVKAWMLRGVIPWQSEIRVTIYHSNNLPQSFSAQEPIVILYFLSGPI